MEITNIHIAVKIGTKEVVKKADQMPKIDTPVPMKIINISMLRKRLSEKVIML
jgi:hypothetical protein